MNFVYQNTTKLYFTKTLKEDLNVFLESNKYSKALVISGGKCTTKLAQDILQGLAIEYKLCTGVQSNPLSKKVEEISQEAKIFNPDVILTIGGGSVHDTGKAVAILYYDNGHSTEDYTVNGSLSVPGIKKALPVITIPTIYGSGAEVSPAALIRIGNEKRVIFSTLLHPLASFIDVALTKGLSIDNISRSAFDSFIQALEGFVSLSSNNISNAFAEITIEYFNNCIPALLSGNITDDILEKLAIASSFSSYVCSTASVGAIHAISDPISGRFDVHHGTALAMVVINVLKKNLSTKSKQIVEKLDLLLSNLTSDEKDIYARVINKVEKIIVSLGLLKNVSKTKISLDVLSCMVKESYNGDMAGNPYEFSEKEIKEILEDWYDC